MKYAFWSINHSSGSLVQRLLNHTQDRKRRCGDMPRNTSRSRLISGPCSVTPGPYTSLSPAMTYAILRFVRQSIASINRTHYTLLMLLRNVELVSIWPRQMLRCVIQRPDSRRSHQQFVSYYGGFKARNISVHAANYVRRSTYGSGVWGNI